MIRTDGAARGNPGPASAGAVLIDASRPDAYDPDAPPVAVIARPLGFRTNNVAEYAGLVLALREAQRLGAREVDLRLDSKLIVEQLNGRWRVKDAKLKGFFEEARLCLAGLSRWSAAHEPRERNRAADALANLALDDPVAAARLEQSFREATAGGGNQHGDSSEAELQAWICVTCGVQYPPSTSTPPACPICEDERQYVGPNGQQWTTMDRLVGARHRNVFVDVEPDLVSLRTEPQVAIGQQALLVRTPGGNVLWDCVTLLDDACVELVRSLGGLAAIAISHPHFYGSMTGWSSAFKDCPVYIHAADAEWVQYPGAGLRLWEGDVVEVLPGLTLINTGGHFEGSAVLHWAAGAEGRGVLLTGDSITVVSDQRWVSFMYSYPNLIPLRDAEVRRIVDAVRPFPYERVYSLFQGRVTVTDGAAAVERSAERYLAHR